MTRHIRQNSGSSSSGSEAECSRKWSPLYDPGLMRVDATHASEYPGLPGLRVSSSEREYGDGDLEMPVVRAADVEVVVLVSESWGE